MKSKTLITILIYVVFTLTANTLILSAQETPKPKEVGPVVGQKIPLFKATDQFGREQNLKSLAGSKGLILLFFRSADW